MAGSALRRAGGVSFLEALGRTAAAAAESQGYSERLYEIGGLSMRLRFVGSDRLERLATALSHLPAPASKDVAFSIDVWAGDPMPEGPWDEVIGIRARATQGVAADAAGWFLSYDCALTAFDRLGDRGYYWLDDGDRDPWFARMAPLSPLLGAWLDQYGVQLIHAGAVGSEKGCVLLVGGAGSGKSHVALACVQAGMGYIGDDTCLLRAEEPPIVQTTYSSAQAGPATLRQLPFLAPTGGDPTGSAGPKASLFLSNRLPETLLTQAPLRAIAIVSIVDRPDPRVYSASPADALAAFAPSSLLQVPGLGTGSFQRLAGVVRRVPCVHLESGPDPARIAEAVGALL